MAKTKKMYKKMKEKNPHLGSTLDSFLKEEGIFEEVKAGAMKKIIALQIRKEMAASVLGKNLEISLQ
jgi:hypothetical protein